MKKEREEYEREQKRLEKIEKQLRQLEIDRQTAKAAFKESERRYRTKKLVTIGGHFEKLYGVFDTPEAGIEKMEEIAKVYEKYAEAIKSYQHTTNEQQTPEREDFRENRQDFTNND